jgi:ATP adenylyltransferase
VTGGAKSIDCVFCEAQGPSTPSTGSGPAGSGQGLDQSSLVVFRGKTCYVILNLYPYNNGHLMVIPNRHMASLVDATSDELAEMMELTRLSEMALREAYSPHGLNMGINLGKPAGAGILDHVHMHIVPRWNGDTNFMTIVGDTRVLAEELPATASRLKPIFERLAATSRQ